MAQSTSVLSDSETTNVLGVPSLSEIPLSLSHSELVHQQCNDPFFCVCVLSATAMRNVANGYFLLSVVV